MARWKLTIEYDGTPFCGWQHQDHMDDQPAVQTVIERAFHGFCQEDVKLHVAGRTDAGVHALGQVAHIDLGKETDAYRITKAVNHHLAEWPVRLVAVDEVHDEFHARFDATHRYYQYRILNRPESAPLRRDRVWHMPYPLDLDAMKQAANHLLGHHDFTSFRASQCQAQSPEKTLDKLDINLVDDEIHITPDALSFLHHQVRNMVGTLVEVGRGKLDADTIPEILAAKDRSAAGPTAPAHGLYLVKVDY